MMVNTNIEWSSMSDVAIIGAIGEYIRHQRLAKNKTQAQIAQNAGVNRWTLSQIEKGKAISLISLIQILRALDLLNVFDSFQIQEQISPIQLAKAELRKRQRARRRNDENVISNDW